MANPALDDQSDDIVDSGAGFLNTDSNGTIAGLGSSPGGLVMSPKGGGVNGPLSLPLNRHKEAGLEKVSAQLPPTTREESELHTTVITVRGSGGGAESKDGTEETALREPAQISPSDRTSLLDQDSSVS